MNLPTRGLTETGGQHHQPPAAHFSRCNRPPPSCCNRLHRSKLFSSCGRGKEEPHSPLAFARPPIRYCPIAAQSLWRFHKRWQECARLRWCFQVATPRAICQAINRVVPPYKQPCQPHCQWRFSRPPRQSIVSKFFPLASSWCCRSFQAVIDGLPQTRVRNWCYRNALRLCRIQLMQHAKQVRCRLDHVTRW